MGGRSLVHRTWVSKNILTAMAKDIYEWTKRMFSDEFRKQRSEFEVD